LLDNLSLAEHRFTLSAISVYALSVCLSIPYRYQRDFGIHNVGFLASRSSAIRATPSIPPYTALNIAHKHTMACVTPTNMSSANTLIIVIRASVTQPHPLRRHDYPYPKNSQ
jgi:hypothetical protein